MKIEPRWMQRECACCRALKQCEPNTLIAERDCQKQQGSRDCRFDRQCINPKDVSRCRSRCCTQHVLPMTGKNAVG